MRYGLDASNWRAPGPYSRRGGAPMVGGWGFRAKSGAPTRALALVCGQLFPFRLLSMPVQWLGESAQESHSGFLSARKTKGAVFSVFHGRRRIAVKMVAHPCAAKDVEPIGGPRDGDLPFPACPSDSVTSRVVPISERGSDGTHRASVAATLNAARARELLPQERPRFHKVMLPVWGGRSVERRLAAFRCGER